MADTKVVGFDSCEAAAASVSGHLVEICTEYVAENDTRFPPDRIE